MTVAAACVVQNSNLSPDFNNDADIIDTTTDSTIPFTNNLPKYYFSLEESNDAIVSKKETAYNINPISYYFTPAYT